MYDNENFQTTCYGLEETFFEINLGYRLQEIGMEVKEDMSKSIFCGII